MKKALRVVCGFFLLAVSYSARSMDGRYEIEFDTTPEGQGASVSEHLASSVTLSFNPRVRRDIVVNYLRHQYLLNTEQDHRDGDFFIAGSFFLSCIGCAVSCFLLGLG